MAGMHNAPLVMRVLATSVLAAKKAGAIIKDVMDRGNLRIVDKGINDLQTEADRSAQRAIIASLHKLYPDLVVIGEESNQNNVEIPKDWIVADYDKSVISQACPRDYLLVENDDIVVWVDPLDGTREYTQGLLSHVTVLIGLSVKGRAVGGVIHQPYYKPDAPDCSGGRTIWGLVGLGIGGDFEIKSPPPNQLFICTTRSHSRPENNKAIEALKPDKVIRVGGAGHKVLLLLDGEAHIFMYVSPGTKKWDTCAPEGVLAAAGGKLTNCDGIHYNYSANTEYENNQGVFASAPGIDHSLVKKIPECTK